MTDIQRAGRQAQQRSKDRLRRAENELANLVASARGRGARVAGIEERIERRRAEVEQMRRDLGELDL